MSEGEGIPPLVIVLRGEREIDSSRYIVFSLFIFGGPPIDNSLENILHYTFQNAQDRSSTPTSNDFVNNLPTFEAKSGINYQPCTVCQESFQEKEVVSILPCSHIYHKNCLLPWFTTHNTCPVCRYEMPIDDPEQEEERKQRMASRDAEIEKKSCHLGNNSTCTKCKDSKEPLFSLECGHTFHCSCIHTDNSEPHAGCPVCNIDSKPKEERKNDKKLRKRDRKEMLESCTEKVTEEGREKKIRKLPSILDP